MKKTSLCDKVAVVTGGARGIGRAIVERLIEEDCRVAFTYRSSKDAAFDLQKKTKDRAVAFYLDVRDSAGVKRMVNSVKEKFGRLDIIINNAGGLSNKPLMMMQEKDWHEIIDTNLNGTYNMTRACIVTLMKQKSGCIINISSAAGITGLAGMTNYSASKAGIIGFTKALAKEVGPYNIRVNAIAPGFIQTDLLEGAARKREEFLRWIPLARFGTPEEVAELVLFLSGPDTGYITGAVIRIDGGLAI